MAGPLAQKTPDILGLSRDLAAALSAKIRDIDPIGRGVGGLRVLRPFNRRPNNSARLEIGIPSQVSLGGQGFSPMAARPPTWERAGLRVGAGATLVRIEASGVPGEINVTINERALPEAQVRLGHVIVRDWSRTPSERQVLEAINNVAGYHGLSVEGEMPTLRLAQRA